MPPAGDLILREVDCVTDVAALQALDTSFSSESMYEVKAVHDSLHLQLRSLPSPRCKRFKIDLEMPAWSAGFVAISDGELCGFIATNYEGWHRRLAIWHFYVDAKWRRRGIGRRLMNQAIESGRQEGAETAWAETSNYNHPGVHAYQRLGFALCGFDMSLYKGTPSDDEFALYLALSIDPLLRTGYSIPGASTAP